MTQSSTSEPSGNSRSTARPQPASGKLPEADGKQTTAMDSQGQEQHAEPRQPAPLRSPSPSSPSSLLPPAFISEAETSGRFRWQNWARIHSVHPAFFHRPRSTVEMQQIVAYAAQHRQAVRVVGMGHSPSDIALCSQHMVDLSLYNRVLSIDAAARTVSLQSGTRLDFLLEQLQAQHLTLPTVGSIGDQTVGGALGTGTHGTGLRCGIMPTRVLSLELLVASGSLIRCSRDEQPELFSACLVNLGCLGIVTELTLSCVAAFDLELHEELRDFADVVKHAESIVESSDYPRLLWFPHADKVVIHRMQPVPPADQRREQDRQQQQQQQPFSPLSIALSVLSPLRPVVAAVGRVVNDLLMHRLYQLLLFAALYFQFLTPLVNRVFFYLLYPWSGRRSVAPAHRQLQMDCLFAQHVTEWSIPRVRLVEALIALHRIIDVHGLRCDFPIEIRFVQRDDGILLSPASGRDSCYINIISFRPFGFDHPQQLQYFHRFEQMMLQLDGRPHWAKPFQLSRHQISQLYPDALTRFEDIRRRVDPEQMFVNDFIRRVLQV